MKNDDHSLRAQIEKWFGVDREASIHISRAAWMLTGGPNYRCVRVSRPSSPHAIVFFRHRDGYWRVYPPPVSQPTLNLFSRVA